MKLVPHPLAFGDIEAILAAQHRITPSNRTKFQARLKNLHRLAWPPNFVSVKGKASLYDPGALADMALAVELTQLGLTPERVVHVLTANRWPTLMAYRLAASSLAQAGDTPPDPMFLYFDPAALDALAIDQHMVDDTGADYDWDSASHSFFYGGIGIVRDNIAAWTSEYDCRLSLVNVTAMLDATAWSPFEPETPQAAEYRQKHFFWLSDWSAAAIDELDGRDEAESEYFNRYQINHQIADARQLADQAGIPLAKAERFVEDRRHLFDEMPDSRAMLTERGFIA